jgi:hypothetical protein
MFPDDSSDVVRGLGMGKSSGPGRCSRAKVVDDEAAGYMGRDAMKQLQVKSAKSGYVGSRSAPRQWQVPVAVPVVRCG